MKTRLHIISIIVAAMSCMCCNDYLPHLENLPDTVDVGFNLVVAEESVFGKNTKGSFVDNEATQEDVTVHNIWVLQFDGTDPTSELREARYYEDYESSTIIKLIASSTLNRIIVVANTFDPDIAFGHCTTLSEFMNAYKLVVDEDDAAFERNSKYCPPMSAYVDKDEILESGLIISFNLKRIVAKVNLTITNQTAGTDSVTITGITVGNVADKLYFFSNYNLPDLFPEKWSNDRIDYPEMTWDQGTGTGDTRRFTFYVPVNKSGVEPVLNNPAFINDRVLSGASYLRVRGTCKDPDDNTILRPVEYHILLGEEGVNCNVLPNGKYSYNLVITDKGDSFSDSRVRSSWLKDFCRSEHANTYLINPPTVQGTWMNYRIPVHKVFEFWNSDTGYYPVDDNALLPGCYGWKVEVIWSEMPITYGTNFKWIKDEGTDYRDWFEFSIPADFEVGTIIIGIKRYTDALKTTPDEFLWSWQMWVTEYNPDAALYYTPVYDGSGNEARFAYSVPGGEVHRYNTAVWKQGAKYDGSFMMDRNLGALSTNYRSTGKGFLIYWFGVKDPHRAPGQTVYYGPSNQTIGPAPGTATTDRVRYKVEHPTKFWYLSEWAGEWRDDPIYRASDIKWGDPRNKSSMNKGVFDPCPPGWRVPTKDAFGGLTWITVSALGAKVELSPNVTMHHSTAITRNNIEWVYPNHIQFWCADMTYYYTPPGQTRYELPSKGVGKFVRCISDKPFD